jgi:hypothetical protein
MSTFPNASFSKRVYRGFQQLIQGFTVRHITSHAQGPSAERFDLVRQRFHQFDAPRTWHHVGTGLSQIDRDRLADSRTAPNHDGYFTVEIQLFVTHISSSLSPESPSETPRFPQPYQLNIVPSSFRFTGK